jgi:hypothetical protein
MTAIDLAAAYTRLGKLCQWDAAASKTATAQQLLQQLDKRLPSVQQQLQARSLSNIIWVINELVFTAVTGVNAAFAAPAPIRATAATRVLSFSFIKNLLE